jgi:ATPase family associated with various cellular activities (AAA)
MRPIENENPATTFPRQNPVTFSPHFHVPDAIAAYWLGQVTIRLRREICWRMNEPALVTDKFTESIAMQRGWEKKQTFFKSDTTAKYFSEQLKEPKPSIKNNISKGSFHWLIHHLDLDDAAAFVLALGLVSVSDNAVGSVISTCLNDQTRTLPNLALAQKLWDEPQEIMKLADPAHPLNRFGLLAPYLASPTELFTFIDWDSPITVPVLIANQLLNPDSPLPTALVPMIAAQGAQGSAEPGDYWFNPRRISAVLNNRKPQKLEIVPLLGKSGTSKQAPILAAAASNRREVVQGWNLPGLLTNNRYLKTLASLCWLKETDLYLDEEVTATMDHSSEKSHLNHTWLSLQSIPIRIYLSITHQDQLKNIPSHLLLPKIHVPQLSFQQRRSSWLQQLGSRSKELEPHIDECSRRFRFEEETIRRIASGLKQLPGTIGKNDLTQACRTHLELDMGELAQAITPRFQEEELILTPKHNRQFQEVKTAMESLTQVHYKWGTAKAWNESGISVLFAGPPGTGKTMAAEILAIQLDLPIFRIDLSQVVNKYIGETEKNLKRLFDVADISDMILFFDEADSIFGKRTEVKDAHDRYANLEISYLLERMERFKGLAILATNRKSDLDDAFLRRLRYIIDFPFPGTPERKRIWQQVIPKAVDYSSIDISFLARQFQLTGGHIRSIVFNACLQAAKSQKEAAKHSGTLSMKHIITALKREYDKMGRTLNLEYFGPYIDIVKELEINK